MSLCGWGNLLGLGFGKPRPTIVGCVDRGLVPTVDRANSFREASAKPERTGQRRKCLVSEALGEEEPPTEIMLGTTSSINETIYRNFSAVALFYILTRAGALGYNISHLRCFGNKFSRLPVPREAHFSGSCWTNLPYR